MQQIDMESDVSNQEIKRAVWDCGVDKSPGPDGFTFGFIRRFWSLLEKDVVATDKYFFTSGTFPKGCNASFIALIWKIPNAKMMMWLDPRVSSIFSWLGVSKWFESWGGMSRIKSWDEVMEKMVNRLSKWKMKTLSIGGRLTLLKAVLGSMPIYHMSIFKEMDRLATQGIDLVSMMQIKIGNGSNTYFWEDRWRGEKSLKEEYPRLYALERDMLESLDGVLLSPVEWKWVLNGSGIFTVVSARQYIDNKRLPGTFSKTRWIKEVPIKVNIHAWKVSLDGYRLVGTFLVEDYTSTTKMQRRGLVVTN
nr:RNA-directed DNA polymerase, eukaryota, reverse transcriptase zinc-binding domain protein [Tanacetum cinerariifolium]